MQFTIIVFDLTKSLGGKTPAQAARMNVPNNWKGLIDEATKRDAITLVNALNNPIEEKQAVKGD